jgi:hypothetical protein
VQRQECSGLEPFLAKGHGADLRGLAAHALLEITVLFSEIPERGAVALSLGSDPPSGVFEVAEG